MDIASKCLEVTLRGTQGLAALYRLAVFENGYNKGVSIEFSDSESVLPQYCFRLCSYFVSSPRLGAR